MRQLYRARKRKDLAFSRASSPRRHCCVVDRRRRRQSAAGNERVARGRFRRSLRDCRNSGPIGADCDRRARRCAGPARRHLSRWLGRPACDRRGDCHRDGFCLEGRAGGSGASGRLYRRNIGRRGVGFPAGAPSRASQRQRDPLDAADELSRGQFGAVAGADCPRHGGSDRYAAQRSSAGRSHHPQACRGNTPALGCVCGAARRRRTGLLDPLRPRSRITTCSQRIATLRRAWAFAMARQ